jgi:hypothetical protein
MADDDQKPKPKPSGIPVGQWSGSDATDALHETIKATGRQNTLLLRMTGVIVILSIVGILVPFYLAYYPPHPAIERHLSNAQINKLGGEVAKLKPGVSEIFLAHVDADRETEQYAHEFADAFRRVGVRPIVGWTDAPDGPDQVGVIIAVKDAGLVPSEVRQLRDALRSIGIDAQVRPFTRAGFHFGAPVPDFVLYIAPRPL